MPSSAFAVWHSQQALRVSDSDKTSSHYLNTLSAWYKHVLDRTGVNVCELLLFLEALCNFDHVSLAKNS